MPTWSDHLYLPPAFDEETPTDIASEITRAPKPPAPPLTTVGPNETPDFSISIPPNSQLPGEKFVNVQDVAKALLTGLGAALTGGLSVAAGAGIAGLTFAGEKNREEQVDEALAQGARAKAAEASIELEAAYKLKKLGLDKSNQQVTSATLFRMAGQVAAAGKDAYESWQQKLPPGSDYDMWRRYPYEAALRSSLGDSSTDNAIDMLKIYMENGLNGADAWLHTIDSLNPYVDPDDRKSIEIVARALPEEFWRKTVEYRVSPANIARILRMYSIMKVSDPEGANNLIQGFITSAPVGGSMNSVIAKLLGGVEAGLDAGTLEKTASGFPTGGDVQTAQESAKKEAINRGKMDAIDRMTTREQDRYIEQLYRGQMIKFYDLNGGPVTTAIISAVQDMGITPENLQSMLPYIKNRIRVFVKEYNPNTTDSTLAVVLNDEKLIPEVIKHMEALMSARQEVTKAGAKK